MLTQSPGCDFPMGVRANHYEPKMPHVRFGQRVGTHQHPGSARPGDIQSQRSEATTIRSCNTREATKVLQEETGSANQTIRLPIS